MDMYQWVMSFFLFLSSLLSPIYFRSTAPFASCEVRSMMPWTTDHWPPPATKRPWNWMCTALKPLTFWRPTTCWPHRKVRHICHNNVHWAFIFFHINMLFIVFLMTRECRHTLVSTRLFCFANRKGLPWLTSFKSTVHSGWGGAVTFPFRE